jgi:hypothetical protein
VTNGTATIKLPTAGANRSALLPIAAGNASMVFNVSFDRLPTNGSVFAYAVARNVASSIEYRAKVKVDSSGNVLLGLSAVNGSETQLVTDVAATRIGAYVPGHVIRLRTYVTGSSPTHVGVRAWPAGTPEPDGWDARAEDWTAALQGTGSWGVRAFLSSGAQTFPLMSIQSLLIKTRNPDTGVSTWYVSSIGSDDAAGTAVAPLRSIQAAVNASIPGDTVIVGSGTYSPFVVRVPGRASAPFRVEASVGDHPVVFGGTSTSIATIKITGTAAYVTIDGLKVQGTTGSFNSGVLVEAIQAAPIVLRDLTVTQSDGYGVRLFNSDNVLIEDSDISHTGTGIQVFGHGSSVVIRNNDVHDNDRMITNTVTPTNDDTGGLGIDLNQSIGAVLVIGNDLWGNRAQSFDYTWDGGAFDIYAASNATITGNRSWDNENILETGKGSTGTCSNNTFTDNQAWAATTQGRSWGIFLRCGQNMLVAHNSLIGIERFVISLSDDSSSYAGSIDGARIVDNILVGTGNGKVFGLPAAGTLPASVSVDHDLVWSPNGVIATIVNGSSPQTLNGLRQATSYETNGISANPLVVDAANGDLRLTSGSPAVDAGIVLPSDTAPFNGAAPDLGALESGP